MAVAEMQSEEVLIAFSTTSSLEEAERIAHLLVENHVIACANIIPNVRSCYFWDDRVCQDAEILMMMKTTTSCLERLKTELAKFHSYQLPELVVARVADGLPAYLDWVRQVTRSEG